MNSLRTTPGFLSSSKFEKGPQRLCKNRDTDSSVTAGPNDEFGRRIHSSGLNWYVQVAGDGPVLLLLHGTGSTTHSWRSLLPILARDFTVIAPDLPGHGHTERPHGGLNLPVMASLTADLLNTLDMQPDFVVGHSAGAAIMLEMALEGRIQPRHLLGINAALMPFGGVLTLAFAPMARLLSSVPQLSRLLAAKARKPGTVERLISGTGSVLSEQSVADYRRWLGDEAHVASTLAMMAGWNLAPLLEKLPDLDIPLGLVVGEGDRTVSPTEAAEVQKVLPGVDVIRLAGLGHLAHEEAAEQVARIVLDELGMAA